MARKAKAKYGNRGNRANLGFEATMWAAAGKLGNSRPALHYFEAVVRPMRQLISEKELEYRTLAGIPDGLLPCLLPGKVRAKDAEEFLKEGEL